MEGTAVLHMILAYIATSCQADQKYREDDLRTQTHELEEARLGEFILLRRCSLLTFNTVVLEP